jgi:hypothetical protein
MLDLLFEGYFMKRIVVLFVILFAVSARSGIYAINPNVSEIIRSEMTGQDTIKERQILYNGILWKNMYHRIKEDQFLFSNIFLPGALSINGQTFENVKIRYDIYSDEIMIPMNLEDIVQLNKEMVDSFTIYFENKVYKFTKLQEEILKGLKGYVNVLYNGKSALYVKYRKEISQVITDESDGEFFQTLQTYLMKDNVIYPIKKTNDLFKILNVDKVQIRNFLKKNKLRVSEKVPESFVPVVRYYDSISQ